MADVIENGVNGILVPPADSLQLAAAIESLCMSMELRKLWVRGSAYCPAAYLGCGTRELEHVCAPG